MKAGEFQSLDISFLDLGPVSAECGAYILHELLKHFLFMRCQIPAVYDDLCEQIQVWNISPGLAFALWQVENVKHHTIYDHGININSLLMVKFVLKVTDNFASTPKTLVSGSRSREKRLWQNVERCQTQIQNVSG